MYTGSVYVHDLCALTLTASNDHNIGIIISQGLVPQVKTVSYVVAIVAEPHTTLSRSCHSSCEVSVSSTRVCFVLQMVAGIL